MAPPSSLRFRVVDTPDVRPALLLGLQNHVSDALGMLLGYHLHFVLLHGPKILLCCLLFYRVLYCCSRGHFLTQRPS